MSAEDYDQSGGYPLTLRNLDSLDRLVIADARTLAGLVDLLAYFQSDDESEEDDYDPYEGEGNDDDE